MMPEESLKRIETKVDTISVKVDKVESSVNIIQEENKRQNTKIDDMDCDITELKDVVEEHKPEIEIVKKTKSILYQVFEKILLTGIGALVMYLINAR